MATKEFSEIAKTREPLYPNAERVESKDLLGKKVEFKAVEFLPSSYGESDFAVVLVLDGKKEVSASLGSKAIVDQLKQHKAELPFKATIVERKSKEGRMYQVLE